MKVMGKKKLINQDRLKDAVSEVMTMRMLDHPYILKLEHSFQTPSNLYMALEFCPNGDLSEILDEYTLLDEEIARFIAAELILALKHLQNKGVIFRDLKPNNILLDS